jgi:hypothetical protein
VSKSVREGGPYSIVDKVRRKPILIHCTKKYIETVGLGFNMEVGKKEMLFEKNKEKKEEQTLITRL